MLATTNMRRRFLVLALLAALAACGLFVSFTPTPAQDPLDNLVAAPELTRLSQDAFGFVHIRPSELWLSPIATELRLHFPKEAAEIRFGMGKLLFEDLARVESLSFVFPTMMSMQFLPYFDRVSADFAPDEAAPLQKGKDNEKPRDLPPAVEPAGDDDIPLEMQNLVIVKLTQPCDRAVVSKKILGKSTERTHAGRQFSVSNRKFPRLCLHFVNDRTYLVAGAVAAMTRAIDQLEKGPRSGKMDAAVSLATAKRQIVIGMNFSDDKTQEMKKLLAAEMSRPRPGGDPIGTLVPLLEARSATLAIDVDRDIRVETTLTFADAQKATEATGSAKDAVDFLRLLGLVRLRQELRTAASSTDNPPIFLFASLLLGPAESALRSAKVERRGNDVSVLARQRFEVSSAWHQAKSEAKNLAKDPAAQQQVTRSKSASNLKQIMLAMHHYHDVNKTFPPVGVPTAEKEPGLSWRVLILPYIEEGDLFNQFNFTEPWDSPTNIKLLPKMPRIYAPIGVKTKEPYTTFYQALVGGGAVFEPFPGPGTRIADITDGTSNTIGIVEAGEPVPWTKPADVVYDPKRPLPKLGGVQLSGGFSAGFMDGSVHFLSSTIDEMTLRALITRAGTEGFNPDKVLRGR